MGSVSHLNDAFSWNITRIAEAFGLHRDTVRKRLKEARVKPSGKKSGVDIYALADVGPALFAAETSNKSEDDYDPNKMVGGRDDLLKRLRLANWVKDGVRPGKPPLWEFR